MKSAVRWYSNDTYSFSGPKLGPLLWSCEHNAISLSDAVQAFSQAPTEEETWVIVPYELWLEEWKAKYRKDVKLVVRLLRSLYGHPLAGKLWQAFLSDKLRQIGGIESWNEWIKLYILKGAFYVESAFSPSSEFHVALYTISAWSKCCSNDFLSYAHGSSSGRTHNCLKASCQWMGAKIFVKALASCSLDLQYRSFKDDSDSKVSQMLAMLTLCTLLQCRKRAEYLFWIIFMTASLSCSSIAGMRCSKRYSRVSWMCSVSPYKAAPKATTSAPGVDLATLLCFLLCQKTGKTIHRSWFQAFCRWWILLTKDKTRNRHHYMHGGLAYDHRRHFHNNDMR